MTLLEFATEWRDDQMIPLHGPGNLIECLSTFMEKQRAEIREEILAEFDRFRMTNVVHITPKLAPSPFKVADPVILIHDQPITNGFHRYMTGIPRGCIGYVTKIDADTTLTAVDFGVPFGEIWCAPRNLAWADAEYIAQHWRSAGRTVPTP